MDLRVAAAVERTMADDDEERRRLRSYLHLKLAAHGCAVDELAGADTRFLAVTSDLLANHREKARLLAGHLCPVDHRIQDFLDRHRDDLGLDEPLRLPHETLALDRPGLARELSLPADGNVYRSDLLESYRVANGVLHNPKHDRRTTAGSFHVAELGPPVPADKRAVPPAAFGRLLRAALAPPDELLELPYTAGLAHPMRVLVSLLLRPLVCPAVPGVAGERRLETRFFAPGSLVSNLDFVESIFGNAGDPFLPANDAGLDIDGWTGHTGCVILAPHLLACTKRELGLPHARDASERQRADRMCWEDPEERYNDGTAFKATLRTAEGVMITLIADNYFGYCKKEVKTQISFSANLLGNAEEEHGGGALAFPSYHLGDEFRLDPRVPHDGHTMADLPALLGDRLRMHADGHGTDAVHPEIVYVPEDVHIDLPTQRVRWTHEGEPRELKLLPDRVYVLPSGYKVRLEKHPGAPSWRLVGTVPQGTFCHKPCTVSGGGKSEISKPLTDAVLYGSLYVHDVHKDLDLIDQILRRDYADRYRPELRPDRPSRPLLSPERSLGSVIKMLTPSPDYTDDYNAWLETLPGYLRALVFIIKRYHRPEWGDDWREHFGVDIVNGHYGHEFKFEGRRLVGVYLRVGLARDGSWRTYKLRQDFIPSDKIQMEDDISASVTVPAACVPGADAAGGRSLKIVQNCEQRLFQRPDDAIHRGIDRQTELDLSGDDNFLSNFEPLSTAQVRDLVEDVVGLDRFTRPMQRFLRRAARAPADAWAVSSAHPRLVDGVPTKNPRYLQLRPDLAAPRERYLAEVGMRLHRRIPAEEPVVFPVDAVLAGRRNNPADPGNGVRPLAVFNPLHYQELPELFMDFITSVTGKSPSTTGFGSEGALTKGPFNALPAVADLNNALVSFILCGFHGFTSAAGYVGPRVRVDHDISLLVPELWARLAPHERDPAWLIEQGYLERVEDFVHDGRTVRASRLGWRINGRFVHGLLGRIFDNPVAVFSEDMLRPEQQDLGQFVDGVDNICEAQRTVAARYFEDGTVSGACPPLQALLHIMVHGAWEGKGVDDPAVRAMFTRDHLLSADWYQARLRTKQTRDVALWQRHVDYLAAFLQRPSHAVPAAELDVRGRLARAQRALEHVESPAYLAELAGTIGADPLRFGA